MLLVLEHLTRGGTPRLLRRVRVTSTTRFVRETGHTYELIAGRAVSINPAVSVPKDFEQLSPDAQPWGLVPSGRSVS